VLHSTHTPTNPTTRTTHPDPPPIKQPSYVRYYGLLGARFCMLRREYQSRFEEAFQQQYAIIHRWVSGGCAVRALCAACVFLVRVQCVCMRAGRGLQHTRLPTNRPTHHQIPPPRTNQRLETNKLRNVAKLFAHLMAQDAVSWGVLGCVRLTEDDTTSSSRIFLKYLFQVGVVLFFWGGGTDP
jgi:hypothetical protein